MKRDALVAVENKIDNAKMFMNEKAGEVSYAAGVKYDNAKMFMVDKTTEAVAKMKKEATDSKAVAFLEMTKTKVRAYIGRAEEAEDYVVDNEYI